MLTSGKDLPKERRAGGGCRFSVPVVGYDEDGCARELIVWDFEHSEWIMANADKGLRPANCDFSHLARWSQFDAAAFIEEKLVEKVAALAHAHKLPPCPVAGVYPEIISSKFEFDVHDERIHMYFDREAASGGSERVNKYLTRTDVGRIIWWLRSIVNNTDYNTHPGRDGALSCWKVLKPLHDQLDRHVNGSMSSERLQEYGTPRDPNKPVIDVKVVDVGDHGEEFAKVSIKGDFMVVRTFIKDMRPESVLACLARINVGVAYAMRDVAVSDDNKSTETLSAIVELLGDRK